MNTNTINETNDERETPMEQTALLHGLAHLHDFFRYGDPQATGALETYLNEAGAGVHAEVLLDELATLTADLARVLLDAEAAP